ncbi:MAG: aldo/keto reductase [Burkholderiales bacterium]|nr:aldo/keto reductase [Burkholderiales bacterium]
MSSGSTPFAGFAPCADGRGTRLGLGGAPLGNLFAPVSDDEARALLAAAWDSGCRSFDTAPHYGHGLSEHRIGEALRAREAGSAGAPATSTTTSAAAPTSAAPPTTRERFVLSSKVGRLLVPDAQVPREQHGFVGGLPFRQHWDYSAAGVRRSVEDSLQRLGLAWLDVAFVHDCDAGTHGALAAAVRRQVLAEALPALRELQRAGLVRAVGLGVNDVRIVVDVLREADLDVLLLAGRYSLLDHAALAEALPLCAARGVRVALGGVFNSGLLATGTRAEGGESGAARFDYAAAARPWVERTARIEAVCDRHGVPLRAAALQFALAHPAVDLVFVGARSAAEWHDALAMVGHPVPPAFWQALRASDLLPAEAPTPA